MPRKTSQNKASDNNASGYWVTYETDMGPVPKGTPALCMKDCMAVPDAQGNDCVLFWANHHAQWDKKDGNVWMVGQWKKCSLLRASPDQWPGGKSSKKAAEVLLNNIFKKGDHVTVLTCLEMLMGTGGSGTAVIDGEGEGAWVYPSKPESPCEPHAALEAPRVA